MINLIVKCKNVNAVPEGYGIILAYGDNNGWATILHSNSVFYTYRKFEMQILNKDKQIEIYNKYFSEYLEMPHHLKNNNNQIEIYNKYFSEYLEMPHHLKNNNNQI